LRRCSGRLCCRQHSAGCRKHCRPSKTCLSLESSQRSVSDYRTPPVSVTYSGFFERVVRSHSPEQIAMSVVPITAGMGILLRRCLDNHRIVRNGVTPRNLAGKGIFPYARDSQRYVTAAD